jgi:hypothetical protein
MRISLFLTALLVICTSVMGCGAQQNNSAAKKFSGERKVVAKVADDFQQAVGRRDAAKICGQIFATELRDKLNKQGKLGCQTAVNSALTDANDFNFVVSDITITNDKAIAQVKRSGAKTRQPLALSFVKQPEGWRLASFGGHSVGTI